MMLESVAAAAALFLFLVLSLPPPVTPHETTLLTDWEIRPTHNPAHAWLPTIIPATVVSTLVANGVLLAGASESPLNESPSEKAYYRDNLLLIPDVNVTGREEYTYDWRPVHPPGLASRRSTNSAEHYLLKLRGLGYKGTLHHKKKKNLLEVKGMWSTTIHDVTEYIGDLSQLHLTIEPPEHPGIVSSSCEARTDPTTSCGQGGDHSLAQDSGAMQFAAGWDWIQGTPDRVTGLYDSASIVRTAGPVYVSSGKVDTVELTGEGSGGPGGSRSATLRPEATVQNLGEAEVTFLLTFELSSLRRGGSVLLPPSQREVTLAPRETKTVTFDDSLLEEVDLWWPHTLGTPNLYDAKFSANQLLGQGGLGLRSRAGKLWDAESLKVGVKTVEAYVDDRTRGRAFKVNGVPLFVKGGNWIATDQMLTLSADRYRYFQEVRMHKSAGLNLIRVWGGGLTEREPFYAACDELGVLVMQEFWMSGDNNGRWGGDYEWPLDHGSCEFF